MAHIGFLHTSPVHVETFTRLVAGESPGTSTTHSVRVDLLEAAVAGQATTELASAVWTEIDRLRSLGTTSIVCTCSTLGPVADQCGSDVIRIDRPMMEIACARPSNIVVLYALDSTRQPTVELLEAVAAESSHPIDWSAQLVDGAWSRFETGDTDGYLDLISAHIDGLETGFTTVVLAQASMAAAADRVKSDITVLSSILPAVRAALDHTS